jgi:hypothetical protein
MRYGQVFRALGHPGGCSAPGGALEFCAQVGSPPSVFHRHAAPNTKEAPLEAI